MVQMAVKYARDGYTFDPLKEKKQKEALERRKAEEVRRALLFILQRLSYAFLHRVCILPIPSPPLTHLPHTIVMDLASSSLCDPPLMHLLPPSNNAIIIDPDPQGKRKAYEERMARKAKREGKEPGFYLAVGADPPSVEELQQLRSMVRGESVDGKGTDVQMD